MNYVKNIFKIISGKPKSGDAAEYIRPFEFYPQVAAAIFFIWYGYKVYPRAHLGSLAFAILGVLLAWQAGWGMSIVRFEESEKRNLKNNT